jgi:hypothetical protein
MAKRLRAVLAALLLLPFLVLAAPSRATDYGAMYDDAVLASRRDSYREIVTWNLENVFLPKLTPEERRRAQDLKLDFPLRGPTGGLFEYFALSQPPRIVMPILSLKFFADLSLAYVWLDANGFTIDTVTDYVSMLKYQDAARFGGRHPDPLTALRIPANAADDPRIDRLYQKILNESVSFVLLHELGHVVHRHPGYGPGVARADARRNEADADRFALEILRRVGQPVDGLLFFLLSAAHAVPHRADFADDAAYGAHLARDTHPLTSERIAAFAATLRTHAADFGRLQADPAVAAATIRGIADRIETLVVPILADAGQQRLMAMKGRNAGLQSLAPRRPGEAIAAPSPGGATGQAIAFDGVFDGEMNDGTGPLAVRALLRRNGERVLGVYSFGAGQGEIHGIVQGDTMLFVWRSALGQGRGLARMSGGGDLQASWGNGEDTRGGGTWTARRAGGR